MSDEKYDDLTEYSIAGDLESVRRTLGSATYTYTLQELEQQSRIPLIRNAPRLRMTHTICEAGWNGRHVPTF